MSRAAAAAGGDRVWMVSRAVPHSNLPQSRSGQRRLATWREDLLLRGGGLRRALIDCSEVSIPVDLDTRGADPWGRPVGQTRGADLQVCPKGALACRAELKLCPTCDVHCPSRSASSLPL